MALITRWKILLTSLIGLMVCAVIVITGPQPLEASLPPEQPRVTVVELERAVEANTVHAFGVLSPRQSLQLTTQVPGEVTWVSEDLEAGDQVAAQDLLLRIDPRDYAIEVANAEARHAQAEANIELERGRAEIARLEWAAWQEGQADREPANPLALRAPQQAEAVARRKAIRAELDRARLALTRTSIRAPWPATVVQANAIVGQVLSVGEVTATLYPLDYAVVELQVPIRTVSVLDAGITRIELRPVHAPDAAAVVGLLDGVVRNLTEDTRLATVRVRIDAPLSNDGWAYGMHLEARILAKQERAVAFVPADLIVSGNLVWIYREGRAERHQLVPVQVRGEVVSVEDNFASGDALILERPIGLFDGAQVSAEGV